MMECDDYVSPGQRFSPLGYKLGHGQGLTVRDWFAGQFISGAYITSLTPDEMAEQAYEMADAMLRARSK